jgi:hypothetical protein
MPEVYFQRVSCPALVQRLQYPKPSTNRRLRIRLLHSIFTSEMIVILIFNVVNPFTLNYDNNVEILLTNKLLHNESAYVVFFYVFESRFVKLMLKCADFKKSAPPNFTAKRPGVFFYDSVNRFA